MTKLRTGRRKYYDLFSHFYDLFINLHARNYRDETRRFLVNAAQLEGVRQPRVLDICCGTGSVILSFARQFSDILAVGYDFSFGMLRKAKEKELSQKAFFVLGDASSLLFADDYFDIVCCSHALYELKGEDRTGALLEMKRVVKPDGRVLIMEHEVPQKKAIKTLFYIRMLMMGPKDSREFLKKGLIPFQEIFSTWCVGGTLVLVSDERRRDPFALLSFLEQEEIDRVYLPFTPLQQLALVAEEQGIRPTRLREVYTGGEPVQITPRLTTFFRGLPACRLFCNPRGAGQ